MSYQGPHFDDQPLITIEEGDSIRKKKNSDHNRLNAFYTAVSSIFLIGTAVLALYFLYLGLNPQTPLNPLPPPTPLPTPTLFVLPQAAELSQTSTTDASIGAAPTLTQTPAPTLTATPTQLSPDDLRVTVDSNEYPFVLLGEEIIYEANLAEEACEGVWISGRVFDVNGDPFSGIPILVTGEGFQEVQISGISPEVGESGYRIKLLNGPLEQDFEIVLLDPTSGQNISETLEFSTEKSCQMNLIIVDFIQVFEYQS